MIPDLSSIFSRYEALRDRADLVFARMAEQYPQCVKCAVGCDDCCHALFDLSFVEAMYINRAFANTFDYGPQRSQILEKASRIDRDLTKIKREMFRAEKDGESTDKIILKAAGLRMPCPLLTEGGKCVMYENRPITCRLYGIPLMIGGESHVCGFSAFSAGQKYPTVQVDKIQASLEGLSAEIAQLVQSRFELAEVYVPLSMALLTRYDEQYLGIGPEKAED